MKKYYLHHLLHARRYNALLKIIRTYGEDPPANDDPPPNNDDRKFTQDEVNSLIAGEKNKLKSKITELQTQLNQAKEGGLSVEDRKKLEDQLEATRKTFLTKEQQIKEQVKNEKAELTKKITDLEQKAKGWEERYANAVIGTELLKAATSIKETPPPNPDLIVDLLRSKTTLEPVVGSDGSPTGEYAPKVAFATTDEKGESILLALSPEDAVKRMASDTARYGALFGTNQRGGFNSNRHGKAVVTDAESYAALRKTGAHKSIGA